MPALVFLNQRWRVGSDDFVLPGFIEICLRIVWLVLVVLLFIQHEQVPCSAGSDKLRFYLYGVLALLVSVLSVTVALVVLSAQGSVMDVQARKGVAVVLLIRVVLAFPEVGWHLMGTVWIFAGTINCSDSAPLWILLKGVLVVTWVAIFIVGVTILLLFEPMHRPEAGIAVYRQHSVAGSTYTLDANIRSHYIQLWERRCRLLCCASSKDETSLEALRNVADVLASIFEDNDLVASDIAAALVLLRLKQKYEEKQEKKMSMLRRVKRRAAQLSALTHSSAPDRNTSIHTSTEIEVSAEHHSLISSQRCIGSSSTALSSSSKALESSPRASGSLSKDLESSSRSSGSSSKDLKITVDASNSSQIDSEFLNQGTDPVLQASSSVQQILDSSETDEIRKIESNEKNKSTLSPEVHGDKPKSRVVATRSVQFGGIAEEETADEGEPSTSAPQYGAGRAPAPSQEWMTIANAHHYMKFALASYGWPWFIYGQCFASLGNMWRFFQCCTPCCCRSSPESVHGDNCCMCHTAAMKAITGLDDKDFLYVHYHNNIYKVPFFVAIDDSSASIVIGIRGTMSLQDTITDMTAQPAAVYCDFADSPTPEQCDRFSQSADQTPADDSQSEAVGGSKKRTSCSHCVIRNLEGGCETCIGDTRDGDCFAHMGMVNAANFVYDKLMETRVLSVALHLKPSYRLVVTGHSLGAGAAVVLAAKLRKDMRAVTSSGLIWTGQPFDFTQPTPQRRHFENRQDGISEIAESDVKDVTFDPRHYQEKEIENIRRSTDLREEAFHGSGIENMSFTSRSSGIDLDASQANGQAKKGATRHKSEGVSHAGSSAIAEHEIICFAFSPPGGLCSHAFASYTREFVMSIIIGDDLVPRLSMNSLHKLRENIIQVLKECSQPKYRLLAQGCWFMLFGISESNLKKGFAEVHGSSRRRRQSQGRNRASSVTTPSIDVESGELVDDDADEETDAAAAAPTDRETTDKAFLDTTAESDISVAPDVETRGREWRSGDAPIDKVTSAPTANQPLLADLRNGRQPVSYASTDNLRESLCGNEQRPRALSVGGAARHTETELCLPGHVLHVRPASIKQPGRWRAQWTRPCHFKELVISPCMMRHHLPQTVMHAMQYVHEHGTSIRHAV